MPARWGEPEPVDADPRLAAALSEANAGRGSWEPGWTVERIDGGEAVVATPTCARACRSRDCRAAGRRSGRRRLRPRARRSFRRCRRASTRCISERGRTRLGRAVVRVYWNVTSAGAPALVRALTARLNAAEVPFRLKVADHPFRLDRCDAAVLYVPGATLRAGCGATLLDVAADTGAAPASGDPGVHAARSRRASGSPRTTADGDELRHASAARLLAEAIVRAHETGVTARRASRPWSTRFAEAGVAIDAPYREPSLSRSPCPLTTRSSPRPRRSAARIVDDAVWHDGPVQLDRRDGATRAARGGSEYRALGPRPATTGTAGVGLFLAQLAAVTGETSCAPDRGGGASPRGRARAGAAAGRPGRAPRGRRRHRAGSRPRGALLGEAELRARARAVLRRRRPPAGPDRRPDVIRAAPARSRLLALAERSTTRRSWSAPTRRASSCSARATVTPHGWSWASPGIRDPHHLCGLSHGAAGIGWALLELFAATGDERFRAGAAGAFAYERSWLDARTGTWPDLRIGGQRRGPAAPGGATATGTWCHGEAGIALTRLRAVALLGADAERRDAELALGTTRRHVAGLLAHERRGSVAVPRRGRSRRRAADRRRAIDEALALGDRRSSGTPRWCAVAVRRPRRRRRPACSSASAASAGGSCGCHDDRIPHHLERGVDSVSSGA